MQLQSNSTCFALYTVFSSYQAKANVFLLTYLNIRIVIKPSNCFIRTIRIYNLKLGETIPIVSIEKLNEPVGVMTRLS